jgi:hypothetical protein
VGHAKLDLLQGTLDLMVLQTPATMGPLHGYGIARRIEQASGDEVLLNQGTIYASLVRLQQRGWISAEMGNLRQQSQNQVLFDHQTRPQTADRGRGVLAETLNRDGSRARAAGRGG